MQHESYRNYKAITRLYTNTQNPAYYNYQSKVCREINESAECDIHLFWKLWKGHTKKKHSICKELRTNNITYRDPTEITEVFYDHDREISDSNDERYSDGYSSISDKIENHILSKAFSFDEVDTGVKSLKLQKSPGNR